MGQKWQKPGQNCFIREIVLFCGLDYGKNEVVFL